MEFTQLTSFQNDVHIHDIVYDFYGKRFATCSTDSKIRIWDLDETANTWNDVEISDCHNGCIWKLSWAHPEFGNLIASCSEDRTVKIWEEQIGITRSQIESKERWLMKAQLTDSRKALYDVKFAPRHLGLKIATASADGTVRIYEAIDVFSLNYWQLQFTLAVEDTDINHALSPKYSEHGLTCLAWSDCVFEPPKLAIGGYSKKVHVWTFGTTESSSGNISEWKEELELGPTDENGQGVVHDVAWAPTMGRSYHLIAVATRENNFKIYTLRRAANSSMELTSTHTEPVNSAVWRLAWNATGTVVSTAGEDGSLNLWRKDFNGFWKSVQELPHKMDTKNVYNYN